MKMFLSCLLVLATFAVTAQTKPAAHQTKQPVYFVDSIMYTTIPVMAPNSIESIDVIKNNPKYPDGAIFIKLKPELKPNLITLEDAARPHVGDTKLYMAMIDGQFITNMAGVMVDTSFIISYEVVSTRDFVHLQHYPEMKILKLTTGANKGNSIRIRG